MSTLCPYELEDNVWEEFEESDDHIVPYPGKGDGNQFSGWNDSCKKPKGEANGCTDHLYSTNKNDSQENRQLIVQSFFEKDTMFENGPWSKDVKTMTSSITSMSNHCFKSSTTDAGDSEFSMDDSIMLERSTTVDGDLYHYRINQISQKDNDLSLFENSQEDKESNELLYYGWQDMGNFEDVDGMFRSSDSTFGLGNLSNGEEYSWFSSSYGTDGSEDASKSSCKSACSERSPLKALAKNNEDSTLLNSDLAIDSFGKKSIFVEDKTSARGMDTDGYASLCNAEAPNGLKLKFDSGDETMKREQVFPLASSQVRTVDSPHRPPSDDLERWLSENRETLFHRDVQTVATGNFNQTTSSVPFNKQVLTLKQVLPSEGEIEDYREVEGTKMVIPEEIESLNVEENSCTSSLLDEIPLEATSFHQLQQVIELLDMRTKLHIRDGLYRLARSAEQRHSYTVPKGKIGEYRGASKILMAQETKRCSGFPDMETNTNPIDRSIAHLLFHRPSDASLMSTNDSFSMEVRPLIHGFP